MAFSGLGLSGGTNSTVEIYDLKDAGAGWSNPTVAPFTPPLYPRMALLPNGRVFFTGHGSGGSTGNGWIFDPVQETWTASTATTGDRTYGSAVILPLLPPSYTPRVMNFGGGSPASSSTEIIDLSAASPRWTPGPNMSTRRIQVDAVILPNGKVLALGGSVNNEAPDTPGHTADLYDPATNTFSYAGTASYSRLYHSTSLLLPDATVMSAGSNPGSRGQYEAAIEIYTPAYLFDVNNQLITTSRPSITAITPASGVIGYNAPFSVSYTSTSAISSAVLVRPGSVTHAFDMEQRLIGLCGPSPQPPCTGAGTLTLTSPPSGNIPARLLYAVPARQRRRAIESAVHPTFWLLDVAPGRRDRVARLRRDHPGRWISQLQHEHHRRPVLVGLPRRVAGNIGRSEPGKRHLQRPGHLHHLADCDRLER
jgi:Galactose oxidase-like, Early set domain